MSYSFPCIYWISPFLNCPSNLIKVPFGFVNIAPYNSFTAWDKTLTYKPLIHLYTSRGVDHWCIHLISCCHTPHVFQLNHKSKNKCICKFNIFTKVYVLEEHISTPSINYDNRIDINMHIHILYLKLCIVQ